MGPICLLITQLDYYPDLTLLLINRYYFHVNDDPSSRTRQAALFLVLDSVQGLKSGVWGPHGPHH